MIINFTVTLLSCKRVNLSHSRCQKHQYRPCLGLLLLCIVSVYTLLFSCSDDVIRAVLPKKERWAYLTFFIYLDFKCLSLPLKYVEMYYSCQVSLVFTSLFFYPSGTTKQGTLTNDKLPKRYFTQSKVRVWTGLWDSRRAEKFGFDQRQTQETPWYNCFNRLSRGRSTFIFSSRHIANVEVLWDLTVAMNLAVATLLLLTDLCSTWKVSQPLISRYEIRQRLTITMWNCKKFQVIQWKKSVNDKEELQSDSLNRQALSSLDIDKQWKTKYMDASILCTSSWSGHKLKHQQLLNEKVEK